MPGPECSRSAPPRITILLAIALAVGARLALPPHATDARGEVERPASGPVPLRRVGAPLGPGPAERAGPNGTGGSALWPLAAYPSPGFVSAPEAR